MLMETSWRLEVVLGQKLRVIKNLGKRNINFLDHPRVANPLPDGNIW